MLALVSYHKSPASALPLYGSLLPVLYCPWKEARAASDAVCAVSDAVFAVPAWVFSVRPVTMMAQQLDAKIDASVGFEETSTAMKKTPTLIRVTAMNKKDN